MKRIDMMMRRRRSAEFMIGQFTLARTRLRGNRRPRGATRLQCRYLRERGGYRFSYAAPHRRRIRWINAGERESSCIRLFSRKKLGKTITQLETTLARIPVIINSCISVTILNLWTEHTRYVLLCLLLFLPDARNVSIRARNKWLIISFFRSIRVFKQLRI